MERIFYCILNEPLKLEPLMQSGAPQAVCDLVVRCTAKKPEDRPQGFGPVIQDLERMIAEQDAPTLVLPARMLPETPAAGRSKWIWPAVLVVLASLGVAMYFAMQPKPLAKTIAAPNGEMVLVPAGEFLFGESKERVALPAFYIDKTEVTNRTYAEFCKETGHALPPNFPSDRPQLPVVNVTILDAMAYAQWAHLRLPSEREWEKAARGVDGRTYPWGEQADPALANVGTNAIQPAISFPGGASPFGALNMVGNVWEFIRQTRKPSAGAIERFSGSVSPPPAPDEPWYTVRGLSFKEPAIPPSVIYDFTTVPSRYRDLNLGFRCVKNAQ